MEKTPYKFAFLLAGLAAAILAAGYLLSLKSPERGVSEVSTAASVKMEASRTEDGVVTGPRTERSASVSLRYRDASGPVLNVSLEEIALMDTDGKTRLVKLDPPATAGTLRDRMGDFSAGQGVMPVAYVEDGEKNEANRRYITSRVRARLPQEQAEGIAKRHGLRIVDRPSYAPEWVVFSAEAPLDALEKIAGLRGEGAVESADVLLASYKTKKALPSDPLINTQWHISKIPASSAGTDVNVEGTWQYGTAGNERRGLGIMVGIIDDGLETAHPDLLTNVNTTIDIDYNGNDDNPNPGVGDRHGTACAGLVGARGDNGIGVAGTAPAATLVGMRLIAGPTTDLTESQAMAHQGGVIQVKSNSWGPPDSGEGLDAPGPLTLSALRNGALTGRDTNGTIYVWAGGNGGRTSTRDNSNYDGYANSIYTIAVGAMDSRGRRSDYSEPGANLVVVAPSSGSGGLGIVTTDNTAAAADPGYNGTLNSTGNYTDTFGGTSAATPQVSGIVALMLKENPALGWRDVQEILIRSAKKILPSDSDWRDNSAGFHFNHDFGAGLVDATAAVTMASTWVNLGEHTNVVSTQSSINASIPNNSSAGVTRQFSIPTSNIRTEHVNLRLSISHPSRGELEISLTSPSGMESRLAEVRSDPNSNYSNWTFCTTRSWGELSSGTWTLKIADRSNVNSTVGTLGFAELTVFGASAAPVNPAPVVAISSPATGSLSSPGVPIPVEVSAEDFDVNGDLSTITKVELFANNVLIGTDTVAPYSFVHNPSLGEVRFVARATDVDSKSADSAPVTVTVLNQTPSITALAQNARGQVFSDTQLRITSVSANDPENATVILAYQWQSSTDEVSYADFPGAVAPELPVSASNAGKLWRCRITASDSNTTSLPSFSEPVNILTRPVAFAAPGSTYSYQSGLVLKGVETVVNRQAIINEFSHGNGGRSQWVEILVMKNGSLRKWQFRDSTGNVVLFGDSAVWDAIPAGTLIVIYDGRVPKDLLLPADTTDAASGKMVLASTNATYFNQAAGSWPSFGNSGGSLFVANATGAVVHSLSYGSSIDASPNIGLVPSGSAAFYFGDSDTGADTGRNWIRTGSGTSRSIPRDSGGGRGLNPFAAFSGGRYEQNFNVSPGAFGSSYPDGWTSLINTTVDDSMSIGNGSETTAGNFNYGSRIGLRGAPGTFEPGFIVLALKDTNGLTNLKISYDVIKIDEQPRNMQFDLQYATRDPRFSSTIWTGIGGGIYSSGAIPTGTVSRYENLPLPAVFNNRNTGNTQFGMPEIYLRWYYRSAESNPGSGARDALAIDNILISSAQSPNILLSLALAPSSVSEISGTAASLATVTISDPPATDLTLQITSSDNASVSVPSSLVIPQGKTSATFPIGTIDNDLPDGTRSVTVSVSGPVSWRPRES